MIPKETRTLLKLLRALENLLSRLHADVARIGEHNDARHEQQEIRPDEITFNAALELPVAVSEYCEAEAKRRWGPRFKMLLETAALAAAIWLACLNLRVLHQIQAQTPEITKSANAAKRSAETAEKALSQARDEFKEDERPYIWVTANGVGAPQLVVNPINPESAQIIWTVHFTNYGKSPAYGVRYRKYIQFGNGVWGSSFGFRGESAGGPIPPHFDSFDSVVSEPNQSKSLGALLQSGPSVRTISIRFVWMYADSYGSNYKSSLCLTRLNSGAIGFCRSDNDIE